ncbi:GntR family transcriptional regulator [Flavobacterium sp. F372]|uniref:GntR family transcriptional regulator n=1 Tax=Flavobacterium bernardetii TaxID=2813823 RepID=A0ABR7IW20_9FLAO|nr:S1-like domain-containing RNA-binding protein [Flavobacterium bernardetii]MBC5833975.1 GntR family transcriptional regulator [Flavobacterium bernardetii]NHF69207.1 GntR family transcriptional regulator [Flavobacterium bernardetii]
MLQIGVYHTLKIDRETKVGLFLVNATDDVLLPNKYVPNDFTIGDDITVFVYLDHEERPVATTIKPLITLNSFAVLKVNYINKFGAFLNWGMEKDLFVPFKEQARPMEKDKRYIVTMYLDKQTGRLAASSKINQFLDKEPLDVEVGQEVDLMVSHITEIGINVIINGKFRGLAYQNEVFETVSPGYKTKGYIKTIRPDGKIDVSFQKQGFEAIDDSAQQVLEALKQNDGVLRLNDNSHPEEIKSVMKMSKKTFKKAIGSLYKQKLIDINNEGIQLV